MRKLAMSLAVPMALISIPASGQTAQPEIKVLRLIAHPSDVDAGNPKTWARPNVDPYSGDIDGAAFLGRVTDIRPLELRESWAMRIRGECHRYQFGSKDVFRTTFGKNKSMLAKPAFTGWADVCLVRADGTAVVYPDNCKNIGPGMAVIERKQVVDLPKRPLVVITTTIAPREPEGSSVSAPFFYWPAPTYRGGNTNIRVKNSSRSAASATTKGGCTICTPSPKH